MTGEREPVDVAVGVLIDAQRRFLMTSRPAGKVYAGYWEFPGGKLEAGETVEQALARELHEELGIAVDPNAVQPWRVELFDYEHARVRLHFCKVFDWRGEFEMREAQRCAWQTLPASVSPLLPGSLPVLRWLAEEGFDRADYTAPMDWLDELKWGADGLLPVITQEVGSNDVLMFAFMNREALAQTVQRGEAVYWSRSRQRLWHKGEESGHTQRVHELRLDCDADVLLLKVTQHGAAPGEPPIACHTGRHSCFYRRLEGGGWKTVEPVLKAPARIYK